MTMDIHMDEGPRRRVWPWVLLAVPVVLIAADQAFRLFASSQVHQQLQKLRQAGYPVTEPELERSLPVLADQENAAVKILEAVDSLIPCPKAFNPDKWPTRTEELGPGERDSLREALTNNAPALALVHEAAQLEKCRFPIDYNRGPDALLPHLAKVKQIVQLLRAEALLASEEGQPDLAVRAVLDGLGLARALDQEPLLISQLVRIACLSLSCSSLERVVNQHALSEAQLNQLAVALQGAEQASAAAFRGAYVGEICLGVFCFTSPPGQLARYLDMGGNNSSTDATLFTQVGFPVYAWSGLRDRDFLFYLQTMERMLEATKAPFPESLKKARDTAQLVDKAIQANKLLIFSRALLPSLQRSMDRSAEGVARLRSAEVALAIEQYRRQHQGTPPDELAQLGPVAASLPADPIDGAPLRYHRLGSGYVVYSIGTDGEDDGGLDRASSKRSAVRKWPPPGSEEKASRQGAGQNYDITFAIER